MDSGLIEWGIKEMESAKQCMRVASLVSIMEDAIVEASEVCQMQHMRNLEKFFDKEGKPIIKELLIPDLINYGQNKKIAVPLFCLIPFSSMNIKELNLEFEAHIVGMADRDVSIHNHMNKNIMGIHSVIDDILQKTERFSEQEGSVVLQNSAYAQLANENDNKNENKNQDIGKSLKLQALDKDILVSFESSTEDDRAPKVKFNITFSQGEVPEAVMKINDTFVSKYINFS